MYEFTKNSCEEFIAALGSSSPVPGGGGAAALVGAVGIALGNMVASLTMSYPRYVEIRPEMEALKAQCEQLQARFLDLVAQDAIGFEPLSRAYRLPADYPQRSQIMEEATVAACQAPMHLMEACCQALDLIHTLSRKGARLAVSDAGCGAACCKAALFSASLNVFINTKSMTNRELAEQMNQQANSMLEQYGALADAIFNDVRANF